MIEVFYPGRMTGYQVVGKTGVKLVPGTNRVPYHIAQALLDLGVVEAVKTKRTYRRRAEPETVEETAEETETTESEAGEE